MSDRRVLVVGTTSDYVDTICRQLPGRAVFLTDRQHRLRAAECDPAAADETLCDLANSEQATAAVLRHMARWDWQPAGVACFDCESMATAAVLAERLGLSYPTPQAVATCRSKFASKQAWSRAGLPCPRVTLVHTAGDALQFAGTLGGSIIVLKPLTGSGSELVFLCRDRDEITTAFHTLRTRLAVHHDHRMYAPHLCGDAQVDPRRVFVAEEFAAGDEYSCDFFLDDPEVRIIRMARKVPDRRDLIGTTLAYVVPAALPAGLDAAALADQIRRAGRALGLRRALGMLDFIVRDGRAVMLEMTPRPGGDCLPPLLLESGGLDILAQTLAFASGRRPDVHPPRRWRLRVGLRLIAGQAGVIRRIKDSALRSDHRIVAYNVRHGRGCRISLPPDDYESRIMGHAIFRPTSRQSIEAECLDLAGKFHVEFEPQTCQTLTHC